MSFDTIFHVGVPYTMYTLFITLLVGGLCTVSGCWRKKQIPTQDQTIACIESSLEEKDTVHTLERLSGPAGAPELIDAEDMK